ncbi:hypothetical protein [Elstera litoralis]|uniref:hypothetical protein n=1 Tax=Elstera litoralis TaxID=552518 RepID=UPI001E3DB252|nr:hypothetical protein [Elstera litoralis]
MPSAALPIFFEKQAFYLPLPALTVDIPASRAGIVTAIDTREIGLAVVAIGGGRTRSADPVDPLVGLTEIVALALRSAPASRSPACMCAMPPKPRGQQRWFRRRSRLAIRLRRAGRLWRNGWGRFRG